ncbi:MAG TPA: mechanosensitive ion channel family protein [Saprospiraceae bacterium]|nr:mechanosensitive ion channel family protein [Saprospiraceae bacterium]
MKRQRHHFLILLIIFVFSTGLKAQEEEVEVTLATPYNTMLVHLHYLQSDSYQPAQSGRVFESVRDSLRGIRLAIKLKQIYDGEGLFVRMNTIPQDSNYIDSLTMSNIYTPFPRQLPDIYLEKIEDQWFYAEASMEAIPRLHKQVYPFGTDKILNMIPQGAQQKALGLMLWQWLGLFLALGLGLLLYFLFAWVLNPLVKRLSRSRLYPSLISKKLIRRLARLISFWIIIKLLRVFIPILQMPIEVNTVVITVLKLLTIVIFVGIALRILDVIMAYVEKATHKTESKMDEQLVPLLTRTLQAVIFVIAILSAMRLFNVNITAWIAGISIGGLAIALAAQDTIKNLFGSVTIFFDKPFQIGDWVNFNGVDGTVEEVGFRSTRLRTFANSVVYVPNGKLADMVINNYGLRVYRRYSTKLAIAYDTPPHLIEQFIEGLKELVVHHPDTRKDYYEVHLNEMSASSLDILFYIFFSVKDWSSELKAKHDMLLNILRLAAKIGVRFAYPTSTIHIEEFPGNGKSSPNYNLDAQATEAEMKAFLEAYKQKYN